MQGGLKHWTRILLASAALAVGTGQVSAETLIEAMVSAYSSNPTLQAERARQRGTDELVPQALSGWRPTVNTEGSIANVWSDASGVASTENDPKSVALAVAAGFSGLKTIMGTKAAEANVEAGKQGSGHRAGYSVPGHPGYMNVFGTGRSWACANRTYRSCETAAAADERFKVGELTRTDVAQSRRG